MYSKLAFVKLQIFILICIVLCLFSALSHGVGALQISIIIIINCGVFFHTKPVGMKDSANMQGCVCVSCT